MKKFYINTVLAFIIWPLVGNATHLIGAEITATAESCQSNTYTITFTVYEHPSSDVEFGGQYINVGFGESRMVGASDDFMSLDISFSEDSSLRIRKMVIDRLAYPGPGEYKLSYRSFNRNPDIVNISRSVNTPFVVESALVVDPLLCNSTPRLSEDLNYQAYTGSEFLQSLRASDPDGDSLSVELVTPLQDEDVPVEYLGLPLDIDLRYAENPRNAQGSGRPTFTLGTEELRWDAPNLPGEFTVAFRINEWRKIDGEWTPLGFVTRDMTVQVLDTVNRLSYTDIITATTTDEPEKPKLQLYPNPTPGDLTLEINDDLWRGATASIHNIIGQEMDQRAVTIGKNTYDISDYQQGIYFLTLRKGELHNVLRFVKR